MQAEFVSRLIIQRHQDLKLHSNSHIFSLYGVRYFRTTCNACRHCAISRRQQLPACRWYPAPKKAKGAGVGVTTTKQVR